jgi:hypothetical protein
MGASIARVPVSFNEAERRRRLERLVRREGSRRGLSRDERTENRSPGCPSARRELSADRHRSNRIWGESACRKPTSVSEADDRNACDA